MSEEDNFGYGPFASNPFYKRINQSLVALTRLLPGQCVVDLGAGTGAVTGTLAQAVSDASGAQVTAVEPSLSALETAQQNLGKFNGGTLNFVQANAECFSHLIRKA